jgi:hypothetical protein
LVENAAYYVDVDPLRRVSIPIDWESVEEKWKFNSEEFK